MSIISSGPKSAKLPALSGVTTPVPYSTATGLALLLSNLAISGQNITRYIRQIPTADFISGGYSFPIPDGYVAAPYQLPIMEPTRWSVFADVLDAYQPVEIYRIGNKSYTNDQGIVVPADLMPATFPVVIYPNKYTADDQSIVDPFADGQSVIVHVYKVVGAGINWQSSNIVNNGAADSVISAATELLFVVTNVNGTYRVAEWFSPAVGVPRSGTAGVAYVNNASGAPATVPYGVTPTPSSIVQRDASGFPVAPTTGATGGQTPSSDEVNERITDALGAGARAMIVPPTGASTVYEDDNIMLVLGNPSSGDGYTGDVTLTNKTSGELTIHTNGINSPSSGGMSDYGPTQTTVAAGGSIVVATSIGLGAWFSRNLFAGDGTSILVAIQMVVSRTYDVSSRNRYVMITPILPQ